MVRLFAAALMLSSTIGSVLDCAPTNSVFKLTSMIFSPDPVVKGQNATLQLAMNVPQQIDAGTATYAITYNFIPLTPTTQNLCNVVNCPISSGTLTTTSSYPIDSSLSGNLQVKVNWKDNSSRDLICVNVRTKIGSAAKQLLRYSAKPVLPLPMCPVYQNMTYKNILKAYKRVIKNSTKAKKANATKVNATKANATKANATKAKLRGNI